MHHVFYIFYRCVAKHCKCKCSISMRYQTSLLASLGFLISFGIRCNMGIAMIQMTESHTRNVSIGNGSQNCNESSVSGGNFSIRNGGYGGNNSNISCDNGNFITETVPVTSYASVVLTLNAKYIVLCYLMLFVGCMLLFES